MLYMQEPHLNHCEAQLLIAAAVKVLITILYLFLGAKELGLQALLSVLCHICIYINENIQICFRSTSFLYHSCLQESKVGTY